MSMNTRAELYFAFSECFKEPSVEFATDVASGTIQQVVTEDFERLNITADLDLPALRLEGEPEEVWVRLKRGYHPLFSVPPHFVLPVESVYKVWSENGSLAGARDMIMGPPALDMRKRYRALGIEIPRRFKDQPDHIALLLEYGGLLCEANDRAAQRNFVATHFDDWIEQFEEEVRQIAKSDFYRVVTSATLRFIEHERSYLKRET